MPFSALRAPSDNRVAFAQDKIFDLRLSFTRPAGERGWLEIDQIEFY